MNADKTIPEILDDIFADFCGICESGLDFIKRQHEYQQQFNQQ